jgi:hypothetical protein
MREAGGRPKARPLKTVKSPEDRIPAADVELNWKKNGNGDKKVEFLQPDELEEEDNVPIAPVKHAERWIVLADSDEEEAPPISFENLKQPMELNKASENTVPPRSVPRFNKPQKEKVYKLVSKYDDGNIIQNLVNQTRNMALEGVTVGMMASMNGEYAKALRETTLKDQKPLKLVLMAAFSVNKPALPYMDEDRPIWLESDAISLFGTG